MERLNRVKKEQEAKKRREEEIQESRRKMETMYREEKEKEQRREKEMSEKERKERETEFLRSQFAKWWSEQDQRESRQHTRSRESLSLEALFPGDYTRCERIGMCVCSTLCWAVLIFAIVVGIIFMLLYFNS